MLTLFPFRSSFDFFLDSISKRFTNVLIFFRLPLISVLSYFEPTLELITYGVFSLKSSFFTVIYLDWLEERFWMDFGKQEATAEL